jgi:hypothetical protein
MLMSIRPLLVFGFVLAWSSAALAQGDQAARLKQEGTDAFIQKDWPIALQKFEEAYAVSKDPTFLFNQARTLESMQELPRALDAIEEFERLATPELKAKVTGLAEVVTAIRARVATLIVKSNVTGAEIRVNDRVVQKVTQPETRVRVTRGPLRLAVVAESYFPCTLTFNDLRPSETRSVTCDLSSRSNRGLLSVQSTAGAALKIDGTARGFVPFEGDLPVGTHQIELAKDGYDTYQSSIVVQAGSTRAFDRQLQKSPGIFSKWWFWTGIGVVAAGTAVTIYAVTTEKDPTRGSINPGVIRTGFSY